jgi:NAD(P)-dependent dehydrogenase (short-subunit alcohol dehydrogenase family)
MEPVRKTFVITGGNGALGRAVARRVAEDGHRAVLLDRQFDAALRAEFSCHDIDLTNSAALAECWRKLGPIDAVCAIAGGFAMGDAVDAVDDTQWDAMFAANVASLRALLKCAVPTLRAQGRGAIVTIGALSAREGKAAMSAYTASKAVVMNLTESLAAELAGSGVRANAVLPSIIDTPANRAAMPAADFSRWVSPAALAEVIVFLAGDSARAINGALIPVTEGQGK